MACCLSLSPVAAFFLRGLPHYGVQGVGVVGFVVTAVAWTSAEVESVGLYPWGFVAYTASTLAIVTAAVQAAGPLRSLLGSHPLRWLGRISYGLYVYHWPVLLWLVPERTGLPPLLNPVAGVGLSIALAAASHRWIEAPIRAGRPVLPFRPWVAAPAAVVAAALALLSVAPRGDSPEVFVALDSTLQVSDVASPGGRRPMRIGFVGDSVADDVAEGLAMWAERSASAEVLSVAQRGCGIARGAWVGGGDRRRLLCDGWTGFALFDLGKFEPDVVVVLTAGWDLLERQLPEWGEPRIIGDPDFDRWLIDQYEDVVQMLQGLGARVVWLTSPCTRGIRGPVGVFDPERMRHMNTQILPLLVRRQAAGEVTLIDLHSAICPDGKYSRSLFGIENFRSDGSHFSDPAKGWLGDWLGPQLLGLPLRDE